jgi:hypothetical protein
MRFIHHSCGKGWAWGDSRFATVMYQHLPPMLHNEVPKQQRTIAAQAAERAQPRARISTLEAQAARFEMIERRLDAIRERLALDERDFRSARWHWRLLHADFV